jgi:anaphase-promoting complex subunit 2
VAASLGQPAQAPGRVSLDLHVVMLISRPKMVSQFTTLFHSLLHSSLPPIFPDYLKDLFTASLSALPEHLVEPPPTAKVLQDIPHSFQKVPAPSAHLSRLGVFPRYATTLSKVAFDEIENIAREEAAKGWDQRRLTRARQRVGEGVANWLAGMVDSESRVHSHGLTV